MSQVYLSVLWRWISTVFVKTLAVWCVVTLFAIIWARWKRLRPDTVHFASPQHEAMLSLLVLAAVFALLFPLNVLVDAVASAPAPVRLLVIAGTLLLMSAPVLAVLIARRQGLETVGIRYQSLTSELILGLALALVTTILLAAIQLLGKAPSATPAAPLTAQHLLPMIALSTLSALAHEFIYRGYLQTRLTAWAGSLTGLLFSSLVYALWHLPGFLGQYNWVTMWVQFVGLLVFGLFLGEVRRRTGSIIPGTLFHAASDIAHTLW